MKVSVLFKNKVVLDFEVESASMDKGFLILEYNNGKVDYYNCDTIDSFTAFRDDGIL